MNNIKTRVAQREYTVDSSLVAEEILRKLRFMKWARNELASAPGRTPRAKLRGL